MRFLPIALAALALTACDGEAPPDGPQLEPPGAPRTAKTRALEAGAAALQERAPVEALAAYLDGFHFYSGRLEAQMEAHHYCANLGEEVTQCVIYDGTGSRSRLMGVEYIVSRRIFESLPEAEKAIWHSHVHEVKSGQLVAPGIPQAAEHELMERLVRRSQRSDIAAPPIAAGADAWQHGKAPQIPDALK